MRAKGTGEKEEPRSLTLQIVEAIAEREGKRPHELTPPLYDVIDAEAAAALISNQATGDTQAGVQVTFTYLGYEIAATGNEIEIIEE